jgi:hypothetical protein
VPDKDTLLKNLPDEGSVSRLARLAKAALGVGTMPEARTPPPATASHEDIVVGGVKLRLVYPMKNCPLRVYDLLEFVNLGNGPPDASRKKTLEALIAGVAVGAAITERTETDDGQVVLCCPGGGVARSVLCYQELNDLDLSVLACKSDAYTTREESLAQVVLGAVSNYPPLLQSCEAYPIPRANKHIISGVNSGGETYIEVAVSLGAGPGGGGQQATMPTQQDFEGAAAALLDHGVDIPWRALADVYEDGIFRDLGLNGIYFHPDGYVIDTADALSKWTAAGGERLTCALSFTPGESPERLVSRLFYHNVSLNKPFDDDSIARMRGWLALPEQINRQVPRSTAHFDKYLERTAALGADVQRLRTFLTGLGVDCSARLPAWAAAMENVASKIPVTAQQTPAPTAQAQPTYVKSTFMTPDGLRELLGQYYDDYAKAQRDNDVDECSRLRAGIKALEYYSNTMYRDKASGNIGLLAANVLGTEDAQEIQRVAGYCDHGPRRGDLYTAWSFEWEPDGQAGGPASAAMMQAMVGDPADGPPCDAYWVPRTAWEPPPAEWTMNVDNPAGGTRRVRAGLVKSVVAVENGMCDQGLLVLAKGDLVKRVEGDEDLVAPSRAVAALAAADDGALAVAGKDTGEVLVEYKSSASVWRKDGNPPCVVPFASANLADHLCRRMDLLEKAGLLPSAVVVFTSRHPDAPFAVAAPADHVHRTLLRELPGTSVGIGSTRDGAFSGLAFPATPALLRKAIEGGETFFNQAVVMFAASADPGDVFVARALAMHRAVQLTGLDGPGRLRLRLRPPGPPVPAPLGTAASIRTPIAGAPSMAVALTHDVGDMAERLVVAVTRAVVSGQSLSAVTGSNVGGGGGGGGGSEDDEDEDGWQHSPAVAACLDSIADCCSKPNGDLDAGRNPHENQPGDTFVGRRGTMGLLQSLPLTGLDSVGAGLTLVFRAPLICGLLALLPALLESFAAQSDATRVALVARFKALAAGIVAATTVPRDAVLPEVAGAAQAAGAAAQGQVAGGAAQAQAQAGGGAAQMGGSAAGSGNADVEACTKLLVDTLVRAGNAMSRSAGECTTALNNDPWCKDVLGDEVFGAIKALRAIGAAASSAATASDPMATCNSVVLGLMREVVPHSHLGFDQWQVRFGRELDNVTRAANVSLLRQGRMRYCGLGGVAAVGAPGVQLEKLVDKVLGEKKGGIYRKPPDASEANAAIAGALSRCTLTIAFMGGDSLGASGAFLVPSRPPGAALPEGLSLRSVAVPVFAAVDVRTRDKTVFVPADLCFSGKRSIESLKAVGRVVLAPPLLRPNFVAPDDAVGNEKLIKHARKAGRAFASYAFSQNGSSFGRRRYDVGGAARRAAAAEALVEAASSGHWQEALPFAPIALRKQLARMTRQAAASEAGADEDGIKAVKLRNQLLAAPPPESAEELGAAAAGPSDDVRRAALALQLASTKQEQSGLDVMQGGQAGTKPGWFDEQGTDED